MINCLTQQICIARHTTTCTQSPFKSSVIFQSTTFHVEIYQVPNILSPLVQTKICLARQNISIVAPNGNGWSIKLVCAKPLNGISIFENIEIH